MPDLTLNGFKHHYAEIGAGEPLIYIAGTRFDSGDMWAPYMQEHAAGFRVLLPDPRGMGGSAHMSTLQPEDWVNDLEAFLDALGLPTVHLAAETLGTRIAARFAADHPARVRTLILNGAIAYSSATGDAERQRSQDPANLTEDRRRAMEELHGPDWVAVNRFYVELHGQPAFHEFYDLRLAAPRITAPTLLIRGDIDDPVHGVAHSALLHELIPTSWLAILPNTEFNALRGAPYDAWAIIRQFVAAHSG